MAVTASCSKPFSLALRHGVRPEVTELHVPPVGLGRRRRESLVPRTGVGPSGLAQASFLNLLVPGSSSVQLVCFRLLQAKKKTLTVCLLTLNNLNIYEDCPNVWKNNTHKLEEKYFSPLISTVTNNMCPPAGPCTAPHSGLRWDSTLHFCRTGFASCLLSVTAAADVIAAQSWDCCHRRD